ncbi:MAG: 50S ribosomal protein L24 [Candidatus Omnitrophota bacterium]
MLRIKKNDIVYVISGKDKGKKAKVLRVMPSHNRAVVEGVNMIKKAMRKRSEQQPGGIIQMEAPIHLSNLALFCQRCSKPSRIKITVAKDGSRARICSRCKEAI